MKEGEQLGRCRDPDRCPLEAPLVAGHDVGGVATLCARGLKGVLEVGPVQGQRVPKPILVHRYDLDEVE